MQPWEKQGRGDAPGEVGGPPGRSGGTPQWGDAGAGRRLPIRGVARGASQWLSPESVLQTPQARPLSETRPLAEPRVPEPAVALRLSVTERTALAGALGGTLSPDGGISACALGDQERGAPRFTACELSRVSHAARGRAHRPVRPGLSRDRTARGPPEKVPNRLQPWGGVLLRISDFPVPFLRQVYFLKVLF